MPPAPGDALPDLPAAPSQTPPFSVDAYAPAQIARRVEQEGVQKARQDLATMFALALLAGAFIALGAQFHAFVTTGSTLGFGPTRLLGALAFSVGLVLVVAAGAELFTGNNLITLAWASGRVSTRELLRNWVVVYTGNLLGALATAALVLGAGVCTLGDDQVAATVVKAAASKASLPWAEALLRGILCNALVCLAVWLCFGARTTTDKVFAVIFPISAFVTSGYEHCVANMFVLPLGMWLARASGGAPGLDWTGILLGNLLPVTAGNVIGGAGLVGAVYWFVYLRPARRSAAG